MAMGLGRLKGLGKVQKGRKTKINQKNALEEEEEEEEETLGFENILSYICRKS
jgi:hypothetical protein